MRVPLPAAMITMSSDAMPFSLLPAAGLNLRRIIGLATLLLVADAVHGLQHGAPGLRPGAHPGVLADRQLCRLNAEQTPMVRDGDRALVRLASAQPAARVRRVAGARAARGRRNRPRRQRCAPWPTRSSAAWTSRSTRRCPQLAELVLSLTPEQLRTSNAARRRPRRCVPTSRRPIPPSAGPSRSSARWSATRTFYGTLDAAQRDRLAALLAKSTFDADRWHAERSQRNRDMVQTLAAPLRRSQSTATGGLCRRPRPRRAPRRARHALTAASLPGLPAAPGAGQLRPGRDDAQPR